jgi:hypothetical protein
LKSTLPRLLASFLLGFFPAYTLYIYILQSPAVISLPRLALTGFVWALSFYLLTLLSRRLFFLRSNLAGFSGLLLLINLILVTLVFQIPYTYALLPVQTVRIKPAGPAQGVSIQSMITENQGWLSFDLFADTAGWQFQDGRITQLNGADQELVYRGAPGQFVQLELRACADCGQVTVSFGGRDSQVVDLSSPADGSSVTLRHEFPSLFIFTIVNFLALEISALLASAQLLVIGGWLFARFPAHSLEETAKPARYSAILPILSLAGLTLAVYALKFRPILFNDDWAQIVHDLDFKILQPVMFLSRRPLHLILPWVFDQFLPITQTILALFAAQILCMILTAILTYILIRELFDGYPWLAFLAAALWVVFPSDYTVLYLTMLGVRVAYLLMILTLILLTRMMKTGRLWLAFLAGALILLSFLMYEGQGGIALVSPVLIAFLLWPRISRRRVAGFLIYYFGLLLGVVWRLVVQPEFFFQDGKLGYLSPDPGDLYARFFESLRTILIGFRFPNPAASWLNLQNIAILGLLAICCLLGYRFSRRFYRGAHGQADGQKGVVKNLTVMAAGGILWAAGYIPLILNFPPNIYGHLSRVNLFSILGAVILLIGLFQLIFQSLCADNFQAVRLTSLVVLVLVALGSIVQLQLQEAYNASWDETRTFYQALFEKVPAVKEGTQFILVLHNYQGSVGSRRPLYTTAWEATSALEVLYNQPDLVAGYRYLNMIVPPFPSYNVLGGVLDTDTIEPVTDPSRLLVLDYDYLTRQITIRQEASDFLGKTENAQYVPLQRILPLAPPIPARQLVQ